VTRGPGFSEQQVHRDSNPPRSGQDLDDRQQEDEHQHRGVRRPHRVRRHHRHHRVEARLEGERRHAGRVPRHQPE